MLNYPYDAFSNSVSDNLENVTVFVHFGRPTFRYHSLPKGTALLILTKFLFCVGFEVFTAVTTKNAVFWDVAPCSSCVNRRFGGRYRLHLQARKMRDRGISVSRWLQTELRSVGSLTRTFFYPEYGGDTFLRNVVSLKTKCCPYEPFTKKTKPNPKDYLTQTTLMIIYRRDSTRPVLPVASQSISQSSYFSFQASFRPKDEAGGRDGLGQEFLSHG
jgi:hypothetical protein